MRAGVLVAVAFAAGWCAGAIGFAAVVWRTFREVDR